MDAVEDERAALEEDFVARGDGAPAPAGLVEDAGLLDGVATDEDEFAEGADVVLGVFLLPQDAAAAGVLECDEVGLLGLDEERELPAIALAGIEGHHLHLPRLRGRRGMPAEGHVAEGEHRYAQQVPEAKPRAQEQARRSEEPERQEHERRRRIEQEAEDAEALAPPLQQDEQQGEAGCIAECEHAQSGAHAGEARGRSGGRHPSNERVAFRREAGSATGGWIIAARAAQRGWRRPLLPPSRRAR